MTSASLPPNEAERLATLRAYELLDTAPEPAFDALTKISALVCDVPIALISLIDEDRQWFKAQVGLDGIGSTGRDIAFCAHAILGDGLMEIPDAALDPRFADNPLVANAPGIRFYAGHPLHAPNGAALGTLCVIDRVPRELTPMQREELAHLAQSAVRLILLRIRPSEMAEFCRGLVENSDASARLKAYAQSLRDRRKKPAPAGV